jgi:hypothetical protein
VSVYRVSASAQSVGPSDDPASPPDFFNGTAEQLFQQMGEWLYRSVRTDFQYFLFIVGHRRDCITFPALKNSELKFI